ncbi:copper homeostasis protein CutC [Robiginitalea sp. M366]|uniref:copper homeostasis protein CutC n=1 Tax=Robiginitalea aestuariiviva TaxID=3036903 RepID=UPI00240E7BD1|nr:copper homeostasis protein CutC [Robiginitalea aestuariiviva]MDG1571040.1 copper homeostasis protein CutC [Robiginitalea aestuariiviva]
MQVEVCANSLASARAAKAGGAHRIELCSELAVGGLTPSAGLLEVVCEQLSLPVHVLIRPRSGNFSYTDAEFDIILRDIAWVSELGMAGVVCGFLLPDGQLDRHRTAMVRDAFPGHFTFHRAFDQCPQPLEALAHLDALGVDTLLSSGQAADAVTGLPLLEKLQAEAQYCQIMPGGGIRPDNAHLFLEKGFRTLHVSGTAGFRSIPPAHGPGMNSPGLLTDGPPPVTDTALIREVVAAVNPGPGAPRTA